MSTTDSIRVTTVVAVDPAAAFAIFTSEIGAWWKPKASIPFGAGGVLRFDAGRLLEVPARGEPFEIGRVLAWEPGKRLAFEWRQGNFAPGERTEVEVRFEPDPRGTRVTLEHRGWDAFPANHPARSGFTGDAFTAIIGLRWADALTAVRALAARR